MAYCKHSRLNLVCFTAVLANSVTDVGIDAAVEMLGTCIFLNWRII